MSDTLPRDQSLFLFQHGWGDPVTLPQDGTARTYSRVTKGNGSHKTALLMVTPVEQNTLPEFLRIGKFLRENGIRVPEIYEAEPEKGLALIEDFGETAMRTAIERGDDIDALYDKAFAILDRMKAIETLPMLKDYEASNVHKGRQRVMEWYVAASLRTPTPQDEVRRYLQVWEEIEGKLPFYQKGFVHGDYHVDNLMLLKDGSLGVIDFQDALYGSPLYDLGNLLEDMRMDVPPHIQQKALSKLGETQRAWIRILNTQFHCRLTGLILWWALRDNKPHYTRFLPRIEHYIRQGLKDPLLKPLKEYFDDLGIDFTLSERLNLQDANKHIAPDAF